MRKYLLLFNLIFLSTIAFSQRNKILYGITAGANVNKIHSAHNPSSERYSLYFGGLSIISLDRFQQWYLQPQLEYYGTGETGPEVTRLAVFEANYGETSYKEGKSVYANNYINVPVYFKYYLSREENSFYIQGGPKFSVLINQKIKNPSQDRYRKDGVGKASVFEFGVSGGIGYSIGRRVEIIARGDLGLTDTYPKLDDRAIDPDAVKIKRQASLSIGISYIIPNYKCDCWNL